MISKLTTHVILIVSLENIWEKLAMFPETTQCSYSSLSLYSESQKAIGSLRAQIYTLNHEIDPSSAATRVVCGASLATSAVIITFRIEEGDTFSVRSANFRCGDVIDAMEIAAAANSERNRMTNQKIADDKPLPTRGVTIQIFT